MTMKNKHFGKKQWILCGMVLLLGGAVYLNYQLAVSAPSVTSSALRADDETTATRPLGQSQYVDTPHVSEPDDYFEAARESRTAARQEAVDILEETLADVKADNAAKEAAVQTAAAVAKAVEQEDAVESLIKAKGFEDCVVYIENDCCHIAVKGAEPTPEQMLQISQIVSQQTDVPLENLSIVAVE